MIQALREIIPFATLRLIPRIKGGDHLRAFLLKLAGCKIGGNVKIKSGIVCLPIGGCPKLKIGKHTFINTGFRAACGGGITIGDHCSIGPNVLMETANHSLAPDENGKRSTTFSTINLESHVWVGAGAIILPGVTVGSHSVIAAGSVVTKDVPPNTLVGGVPAKPMKKIDEI